MTARKVIGFAIGIVAEQTGMHPQTLREYERRGLVVPARTPGGARRYREQEIKRLQRIQQLTEQGLSLAGVEYVLNLEDRIANLEQRNAALERTLHAKGIRPPASPQPVRHLPVPISMSLEIVHVPRPKRGPRWRNDY
jgi:hypothetical protein